MHVSPVLDSERTFVGVREVRREFALPDEVAEGRDEALAEVAPQALLRDLHRPVKTFEVSIMDFERHVFTREPGAEAYSVVKRLVLADYRVPMERLLRTNQDAHESMRELKAILALPWSKAPKLGTKYIPASMGF